MSLYSLRTTTLLVTRRHNRYNWTASGFESKYGDKLRQRAKDAGLSVEQLKVKAKHERAKEILRTRNAPSALQAKSVRRTSTSHEKGESLEVKSCLEASSIRKDSSPVKQLSTILNMRKVMSKPHTAEEIGSLWTAYHMSKSCGTGLGYVCASIPLPLYNKMASIGQQYSSFVVPIPRAVSSSPTEHHREMTAHEFYFLEWSFHEHPPIPRATEDLFEKTDIADTGRNPRTSTVLFTPLQEYKLRSAFATPYLVLTHYTDFATSHGLVLLRGEITPAAANCPDESTDGRYLLNQNDAQLLSMTLQKFYLWKKNDPTNAGEELLKCFHETPDKFRWEDLLNYDAGRMPR